MKFPVTMKTGFTSILMTAFSLFISLGLQAQSSPAAQAALKTLYGTWEVKEVHCRATATKSMHRTQIFQLPGFDFEPAVVLDIQPRGSQIVLGKTADTRSCRANPIQAPYFLTSRYIVDITPLHQINGQDVLTMSPVALESFHINSQAFKNCGGAIRGFVLNALTGLRYPDYFYRELRRRYHLVVSKNELYLQFQEPEICPESDTLMIFGKRASDGPPG